MPIFDGIDAVLKLRESGSRARIVMGKRIPRGIPRSGCAGISAKIIHSDTSGVSRAILLFAFNGVKKGLEGSQLDCY